MAVEILHLHSHLLTTLFNLLLVTSYYHMVEWEIDFFLFICNSSGTKLHYIDIQLFLVISKGEEV